MQEMRVYLLSIQNRIVRVTKNILVLGSTALWTLREIREKIGVEHEQIEIADYELPFRLHSDMQLWEINVKCRMVLELEGTPVGNEMKAIIQQRWFSSFDEFIDHKRRDTLL